MRPALVAASALCLASSLALAAPPRTPRRSLRDHRAAMAKLHAPMKGEAAPLDELGRPKLVLRSLNTEARGELGAASDQGGFSAEALEIAAVVLADPRSGLRHPVEPLLLDLVYRAARHFRAPEVRVVSGYRKPRGHNTSNHGRGRAIDLILPGVSDKELVAWAKTQGGVGVGLYPVSSFVHLDVRPRSYFWTDASGPGQRSREVPVRGPAAAKADEEGARRGAPRVAPFRLPVRVRDVDAHAEELPEGPEDDGDGP